MVSRVHPKGNGRPEEGVATRLRVMPQEILADLRAGMPRRFLIAKYRLPQKGSQVKREMKIQQTNKQNRSFFKRLSNIAPLHENSANCLTGTEELLCTSKLILLNSHYASPERNTDILSKIFVTMRFVLCVLTLVCVRPQRNPRCKNKLLRVHHNGHLFPQASHTQTKKDMNKYLMTLPEETRSMMLSLLRKMLACFEAAGGDKVVGLPSEVSTAVVTWLKQLLEDVFDLVLPPLDRRCSSVSTTSDEEEEEEEEESEAGRRERKCVPSPAPPPPPPQVLLNNLSLVSVDNRVPSARSRRLFITQRMPRVCQTAFIKTTTAASVSHAIAPAKKSCQASAERKRSRNGIC